MEKLQLGVAYHGNRILKHVKEDMTDIVNHNMNYVVHMFTHNDMDRHSKIMKEIFDITRDNGLDFWVDNWGLSGVPGDKSHFLQYHPESHQVFSDGTVNPVGVCFNSPAYMDFTKQWIEMVREAGGVKLFWDEPHLSTDENKYACCCPVCQKLFEEKYGKPMPKTRTQEVIDFQSMSIGNYFAQATKFSHDMGCENITCLMPTSLDFIKGVKDLPYMDDIGTDPYWLCGSNNDPYEYVYTSSKEFMDEVKAHGKKTHIWIQTYENPAGCEDDIYLAVDAAYDAGARNIVAWSYRGGEPCNYRAANPEMVWNVTGDAMRRIKDRHLDEIRAQYHKKLNIK